MFHCKPTWATRSGRSRFLIILFIRHPGSKIGPNCLLNQQVTLGYGGKVPGNPTLGGHVDVGAGAKILGNITIGDHAKIGANAVVLQNVPPHATAVGIPARIISKTAPTTDTDNGQPTTDH